MWQASAEEPNCRELRQDELPRKPKRRSSQSGHSRKFVKNGSKILHLDDPPPPRCLLP
jgi:hypothetical protein